MKDTQAAAVRPVAWMWQYIGRDPLGDQFKPCARSLQEIDPANPPYPESWKPVYPLFAAPPSSLLEQAVKALESVDSVASYTEATIAPGNFAGEHVHHGDTWVEVHAGRAGSAYRQLRDLREKTRATLAALREALKGQR